MNTPTLETDRLILRRFSEEDINALFLILKNEEVNTFLPWYPVKSIDETRKFYCSATRFLRNRDRIVEKKSPILRSISEARSLASTAPQQGERPTQEGGLF